MDKRDYEQLSSKTRVRHAPAYTLEELAVMHGLKLEQLRQMMSVASRKGQPIPQAIPFVKTSSGKYAYKRVCYYRKEDFVKFIKEKTNEATDTTEKTQGR